MLGLEHETFGGTYPFAPRYRTVTWASAPWPGGPLPRLLGVIRSERGERFVLEEFLGP